MLPTALKSLIRRRIWRPIRGAFYDRHCEMIQISDELWRCPRCKREQPYRTVRRCTKQVEYLGDAVEAIIIVMGYRMQKSCGCAKRKQWLNRWSRAIHERLFTPRKESP